MKKEFKDIFELSRESGLGFEDTTKMVIASETMWANELGKNPKYAYWKTHPYPLYHSMLFLVEGIMATGERAFHPGQPGAVSHDDSPAVDSSSQGARGGDDTSGDSHLPGGGEENAENGDKATENDDEVSATVNSSPPPATQSHQTVTHLRLLLEFPSLLVVLVGITLYEMLRSIYTKAPWEGKDEEIKILMLFARDKAVADSYASIRKAYQVYSSRVV
ncbi:hypothetical protein MPER_05448, partial [Moniliophthora perniciosa FA553]